MFDKHLNLFSSVCFVFLNDKNSLIRVFWGESFFAWTRSHENFKFLKISESCCLSSNVSSLFHPSNTNTHTLENAVHNQKSTERNENILSLDILSFLFFVLVENGPQTNQRRGQRQNFTTEGYR